MIQSLGVHFDLGTPANIHLALAPLSEVSQALAAELIAQGNGDRCGECDRPFTPARKRRALIRLVSISEAGLAMNYYLICGACRAAAEMRQREGGSVVAEAWRVDAQKIHDAGRLMNRPAEGRA